MHMHAFRASGVLSGVAGSLLFAFGALAEPLGFAVPARYPATIFQQVLPDRGGADGVESAEVPAHLRRQVIENPTNEVPGTIVIDTANTYLYLVLGGCKAAKPSLTRMHSRAIKDCHADSTQIVTRSVEESVGSIRV